MFEKVNKRVRPPLGVRDRLLQVDGTDFAIAGEYLLNLLLRGKLSVN